MRRKSTILFSSIICLKPFSIKQLRCGRNRLFSTISIRGFLVFWIVIKMIVIAMMIKNNSDDDDDDDDDNEDDDIVLPDQSISKWVYSLRIVYAPLEWGTEKCHMRLYCSDL